MKLKKIIRKNMKTILLKFRRFNVWNFLFFDNRAKSFWSLITPILLLYFAYAFLPSCPPSPKHSKLFTNAAVATDAESCSIIGTNILKRNGSVVDAAIAAMLCVELCYSHSTGIGGGGFMVIYNATTKRSLVINSREVAPLRASKNMFEKNPNLSAIGTLAVGIPGQVAGFWEAHQRFGVLPWKDLFAPTIKLAQDGLKVSRALAFAIQKETDIFNKRLNLWPVFTNDDGSLKQEGDIVRRPQLAKTLQIIADEGMQAFYNGSLTADIISDLEDGYGDNIITEEDLNTYHVEVKESLNVSIGDNTIFTPGPPASGPVMALILNILKGYNFTSNDVMDEDSKILTYHRIVESFRFAYAKRSSLGDDRNNPNITELAQDLTSDKYAENLRLKINDSGTSPVEYYEPQFFVSEDHGTAHLSIIGQNGDAVSFTSSINHYFGSRVRGNRTGIIFNSVMNDFSFLGVVYNEYGFPPSPNNFIKPGNRPLSSMCPSIIVERNRTSNENFVKMVVGASGGSKITSATALTIINAIFFGNDAGASVEAKRIHNQLLPNFTYVEEGFDEGVIIGLKEKGHEDKTVYRPDSMVQAILVKDDGTIEAASDSRKGGIPDGY